MFSWKRVHDLRLITAAICVAVVLPEIILTVHLARVERQNQISQIERDVIFVARLLAAEEQRWFYETRQFLSLLSRSEAIFDPTKCRTFLNGVRHDYPEYSGLSLASTSGDILCSASIPPVETRNILKDAFFQNVITKREFSIGTFAIGRSSGLPRLRAAYPIKDAQGEIEAVLVLSMPLDRINAVAAIHLRPLFQRYTLTQVDQAGTVLAHQPESGDWIIGDPAPELSFAKRALGTEALSFIDYGPGNQRFLYSSAVLPSIANNGQIRIILGVPESVAIQGINKRSQTIVFLMLGAFGLSLGLGVLTAQFYVVRPAAALGTAAKKLASGDYTARSEVAYGWAQLGGLAKVMDSMAEKIQARAEEVRSAEVKFRTIVESVPDGIVIIDHLGRIVLANAQAETLFGWKSAEVVGKSIEVLLPSRFHDRRAQPRGPFYSIPAHHPKGLNYELHGLRRDSTEFPIEITMSQMITMEGVLIAASIRDITARKQASERLIRTTEKLKEAQRISQVGSWEWDIATGLTEQSDEMLRILGLPPEECYLTYERFLELVHPEDIPILQSEVQCMLTTGKPWSFDFRIVRANGSERFLHSEAYAVYNDSGQLSRVVGVDQDVTDQRRAEQRLRMTAERLRKLARHLHDVREEERSLISREIHDELGQSLSGLKMDLYSLARQLPSNDSAIQNRIDNTMKHVEEIIRDVRRLSAELRPPILDLGLATAIEAVAEEFESRSTIATKLRVPPGPINLDQHRSIALYRIVQEALTNVARHSGATVVCIDISQDCEYLHLVVSDDGKGMDVASSIMSSSLGITGMKERAILLGGELDVTSELNRGTIVSARIPLVPDKINGNNAA